METFKGYEIATLWETAKNLEVISEIVANASPVWELPVKTWTPADYVCAENFVREHGFRPIKVEDAAEFLDRLNRDRDTR